MLLSYIHIENKKEIGESYLREHDNRYTVRERVALVCKTALPGFLPPEPPHIRVPPPYIEIVPAKANHIWGWSPHFA